MRQEIVSGRWPPGEKLPSERDLCVIFGVSRPTVRGAIEALVDEGFLRREKGRGTFVASPKIVEGLLQTPFGFSDSMQSQAIEFTTRVLTVDVRPAPYIVARELRLADGALVIYLERLRTTAGEPILTVASYLPEAGFPGLTAEDFTRSSLYHLLRTRYGMTMARARRYMEAVPADKHEAELLGVRVGAPLMQIDSTTYTESGTPFEFYRAYHRGDRTRFLVESFRTLVPEGGQSQDLAGTFAVESFISS
jgi:GntR family transcriptional regulator